jgi:hypothetical protein
MGAAFGAGVAFTLVSGQPNPLQSAFTTGAAFAAFNGLFYQVRPPRWAAPAARWTERPAGAGALAACA